MALGRGQFDFLGKKTSSFVFIVSFLLLPTVVLISGGGREVEEEP